MTTYNYCWSCPSSTPVLEPEKKFIRPILENNLTTMDNKVNKKLDKVLKNRNRNNSIAEKARQKQFQTINGKFDERSDLDQGDLEFS